MSAYDDRRILVRRSKKLEKVLGETPPSELIIHPAHRDTGTRYRAPLSQSRSASHQHTRSEQLPSGQAPRNVRRVPVPALPAGSSTESLLSTSSLERASSPTPNKPKLSLPLDAQAPQIARVDLPTHHRPRTPPTPALRPLRRADSAISYFSLGLGSGSGSGSTTPSTPDERKRWVQNVSKLSRTLGECLPQRLVARRPEPQPETRVMIRQEAHSLELAGRPRQLVPQRGVMSDTASPLRGNLKTKWLRERGSKYYVEEDYEVIRSTLRALR
ncbi:hypothetical protein GLOTRDRAFT_123285 [Gloeophyllum trabeum ATCC 11539]|uniref:Uncharacterized protein n=1 Tax=Gloeophyllum trabeum (strain ATCC 11539 / FP-39264 / Madison 617) TaxID=670483 RepID=S7PUP4_GLOTA|nr:uncharacterized protein GLOTRDRAFT_123285 [Gloeophyllum trabeum ATCC 11539]EPQ50982.1 hypothetical protein GLOTRDRAFT_123285 [Gloeophyllum trabeum ATCC 11539]